jgi:hypothetical protein
MFTFQADLSQVEMSCYCASAPVGAFRSLRVGGDEAMRTFEEGTGGGGTRASV